jgi:predicted DNA-binding protein (MmcQ/YjbR family)
MTLEQYNRFCASLPHSEHVVQWGGAHVWKLGGKVFAIAGWGSDCNPAADPFVTFKCSQMSFDMLRDAEGCRPAPYLASRGMLWIQRIGPQTLDDNALRDYISESRRLVGLNLTKSLRRKLGLDGD